MPSRNHFSMMFDIFMFSFSSENRFKAKWKKKIACLLCDRSIFFSVAWQRAKSIDEQSNFKQIEVMRCSTNIYKKYSEYKLVHLELDFLMCQYVWTMNAQKRLLQKKMKETQHNRTKKYFKTEKTLEKKSHVWCDSSAKSATNNEFVVIMNLQFFVVWWWHVVRLHLGK